MKGKNIWIQTPDLKLAARAWGPADGKPVLALHGWLDNVASFDPIAPLLEGIRLVALDFPGHGWSDHRPHNSWYYLADYTQDIHNVAAALGWEKFSLLGHSLGGAVSTLYSAACPDRIERLALIEALGPLSSSAENAPDHLHNALAKSAAMDNRPRKVYPDIDAAARARESVGGISYEAAFLLTERGVEPVEGGVAWRRDRRLTLPSPFRLTERQIHAFIDAIQCPTLVVLGSHRSPWWNEEAMQARADAAHQLEVVELDGYHHLHMETPKPVAEAINRFFAAP
jgi:pimeloyl-ACP methyl ester carboxylesterase